MALEPAALVVAFCPDQVVLETVAAVLAARLGMRVQTAAVGKLAARLAAAAVGAQTVVMAILTAIRVRQKLVPVAQAARALKPTAIVSH